MYLHSARIHREEIETKAHRRCYHNMRNDVEAYGAMYSVPMLWQWGLIDHVHH